MADIHAAQIEKHVFADIGGVVGDSFQVPHDEEQVDIRFHSRRIFLHRADKR